MSTIDAMTGVGMFELVVRTVQGEVRIIDLGAANDHEARTLAARDGLQVLACTARGRSGPSGDRVVTASRLGINIANFSFELSSLMAAGLSVVESLRTLAANETAPQRRQAIQDIVKGVSEGLTLSAALQRSPGRFPPLLVATVSASEQTGDLSTALRRYAEHQLTLKALRDKVVGAAVYPALLLAVGMLVVVFLLAVVVPKFAVLIESSRQELPWSSRLLMSWGSYAAGHAWEIALVGLLLLVAFVLVGRQVLRGEGKAAWIDAIPVFGPTLRQFRHVANRTTGMLVRGDRWHCARTGATLLAADRQRPSAAVQAFTRAQPEPCAGARAAGRSDRQQHAGGRRAHRRTGRHPGAHRVVPRSALAAFRRADQPPVRALAHDRDRPGGGGHRGVYVPADL
jgi:general secretion pathway protein F